VFSINANAQHIHQTFHASETLLTIHSNFFLEFISASRATLSSKIVIFLRLHLFLVTVRTNAFRLLARTAYGSKIGTLQKNTANFLLR
jgi:hypothetical protein